jgi:signal transduction histidine kinase
MKSTDSFPVVADFTFRIEGDVDAPGTARRMLWRMRDHVGPDVMQTVTLLVSELVSNAVRHASADFVDLKAQVTPAAVRVEVQDGGPGFMPKPLPWEHGRPHGWGLYLVEELSDRWGVSGARVWFEVDRA